MSSPDHAAGRRDVPEARPGRLWIAPALLTLAFVAGLAGILWLVQLQNRISARADLQAAIRSTTTAIEDRLNANERYMRLVAADLGADTDPARVRTRIDDFMANRPEVIFVACVDRRGEIAWMTPADLGEDLAGLDAAAIAPEAVVAEARDRSRATYSGPMTSYLGESGWTMHVPIAGDADNAIISVAYSADRLLRQVVRRPVIAQHHVRLISPARQVVAALPKARPLAPALQTQRPLTPPGNGMALQFTRYRSLLWNWQLVMLLLLCAGLFAGMGFGMWSLRRENARRHRAESQLRAAHDSLEARVQQRTADLEEANRQLQHEIAERQQVELRLREHQDQLAHVTRLGTMGEMAAGLAHELNQPLGTITSYADGALQLIDQQASEPDQLRYALREIGDQAFHAGRLIHRLRELVDQGSPQRSICSIHRVVDEVLELLQTTIRDHRLQIETEVAPDLPRVLVDRIQIQQVLINLLHNACEAMQDSQQRRLTIEAGAREDAVEVRVSDTGRGCDPQTLQRLFDAFYTTRPDGMGMGLAICRSIIEAHGAHLSAAINEAGGMTFVFTLPLVEDPQS